MSKTYLSLLGDTDYCLSYDDNIRISALNEACVIIRRLSLINDKNLLQYIADAFNKNDIFKLTKKIYSIEHGEDKH